MWNRRALFTVASFIALELVFWALARNSEWYISPIVQGVFAGVAFAASYYGSLRLTG